ncbi:MAG: alkaline phosphatase family protein, partial [Ferruginibacter sp.]|nr:alkaline phosphatase family protein [Ferruginibacter sp.]
LLLLLCGLAMFNISKAQYNLVPNYSFEDYNTCPDFICLNFANADMVGHTGVWGAVIIAVETVDECVEKVVTKALGSDYAIFLLADHGNADYEINEDGTPNTAHTLNLVPFFVIDNNWRGEVKPGKLGDVAPTMLKMMGLKIPELMKGEVLI